MSSNMVVMTFSNEYTAEQVRDRLFELQKAHLIKVDDKEGDHDMLRRRPDEQLGPRAGRGGRYLMRHKLLALGDDYYIENALGQRSTL